MSDYYEENEDAEEEGGLYEHYRLSVDPGQSSVRIDKFCRTESTMLPEVEFRLQLMLAIFW